MVYKSFHSWKSVNCCRVTVKCLTSLRTSDHYEEVPICRLGIQQELIYHQALSFQTIFFVYISTQTPEAYRPTDAFISPLNVEVLQNLLTRDCIEVIHLLIFPFEEDKLTLY